MSADLPRAFRYSPKVKMMLFAVVFFIVCATVTGWAAATKSMGEPFGLDLPPDVAVVMYWILCALSVGCVAVSVLGIREAMGNSVYLEITRTGLKIPHGFRRRKLAELNWDDISEISEHQVSGHKFLNVYTEGKKYWIGQNMMPSAEDYEEARQLIMSALQVSGRRR